MIDKYLSGSKDIQEAWNNLYDLKLSGADISRLRIIQAFYVITSIDRSEEGWKNPSGNILYHHRIQYFNPSSQDYQEKDLKKTETFYFNETPREYK